MKSIEAAPSFLSLVVIRFEALFDLKEAISGKLRVVRKCFPNVDWESTRITRNARQTQVGWRNGCPVKKSSLKKSSKNEIRYMNVICTSPSRLWFASRPEMCNWSTLKDDSISSAVNEISHNRQLRKILHYCSLTVQKRTGSSNSALIKARRSDSWDTVAWQACCSASC